MALVKLDRGKTFLKGNPGTSIRTYVSDARQGKLGIETKVIFSILLEYGVGPLAEKVHLIKLRYNSHGDMGKAMTDEPMQVKRTRNGWEAEVFVSDAGLAEIQAAM
jgi:hypothetical protein